MDRLTRFVRGASTLALGAGLLAGCDRMGSDEERLAREVRERVPQVEQATGLKFRQPPKVEARSRAQVREFVLRKFDEEQPAQELAGEEQAYKLLGLIPDTMNLRAFITDLLTEQIVGFYDPTTKVLYVVEGGDADQRGVVITHELVHALQDQYVNLDSIMRATGDADRTSAAQALIEGHATYEQIRLMLGKNGFASGLGGWQQVREMIRENQASTPVFASAPVLIQESILFPYLTGADFVHRYKQQRGDTANPLARFPQSSEQLLHTSAFLGDSIDRPTRVVLPAPTGGTRAHESNLGEFGTRLFLYEHLSNITSATSAAMGWDGDRYVVVRTPRGNAIAWLTVWDSPLEAAEFGQQLERAVGRRYETGSPVAMTGNAKRWIVQNRAIVITPGEIGGRTVVLYIDAPAGTEGGLLELGKVRLEQ
ncbi:MAG TPA: hypothetical protein VEA99_19375 [Gemmatimonadaceae bacterium]|nr:hypothetical protein [Gemmatimonadaceae bacterium]